MRNNHIIFTIIILTGALFILAHYLTKDDSFPSQMGTATVSPTTNVRFSSQNTPTYSAPTISLMRRSTSLGTYSSSSAAYNTQLPTRSLQRGAYNTELSTRSLQSSATLHSYGGGATSGSAYSVAGGTTSSTSSSSASYSVPTFATMGSNNTMPTLADASTLSQSATPYTATTNFVTRRKIYSGETPDEDGEYYDPELEAWVKAPTGTSNIDGLGAGQFNGQEAMYNGKIYVWDAATSKWYEKGVENPSEVNGPIGDGLWILLLLALLLAAKKWIMKVEN